MKKYIVIGLYVFFTCEVAFSEENILFTPGGQFFGVNTYNTTNFFQNPVSFGIDFLKSDIQPVFPLESYIQFSADAKEKGERDKDPFLGWKIGRTIPLVLVPLAHAGLSVLFKEKVYRENPSDNFMGTVNSFITMSTVGLLTGYITFALLSGGGIDSLGALILGGFIGFIAGAVVAFLPPVRTAFANNPFLYYSAPIIPGALATHAILRVWGIIM